MKPTGHHGVGRTSRRFNEQATEAFRFLESEWGFARTEASETLVRYESGTVYIQVFHGRVSQEIGVELGLRDGSVGECFDLAAIVEAVDPDVAHRYRVPAALDERVVGSALLEAAALLMTYGRKAANADAYVIRRLKEIRQSRIDTMVLDSTVTQVRPRAESAFRRGDFEEAERLYSSILSSLSPVELKRLEIARKRIGASPSGSD